MIKILTHDNSLGLQSVHRLVLWLSIIYTAFTLYGSLVPLRLVPIPFDEAIARFSAIKYLELGIASRADWVANILLFVPLAVLWQEVLTGQASRRTAFLVSMLVFAGCSLFAAGIEFVQEFFPQRTVSLNDIFAENIGAAVGLILWWLFARRARAWLVGWWSNNSPQDGVERFLYAYLIGLFVYNILPLDLTVSPVELFHKWSAGNIQLLPFQWHWADPIQALYDVGTDILIWVPVGVFLAMTRPGSLAATTSRAIVAAVTIEICQLFVYSRVSDITDVFTAATGGLLGAAIALYGGWALGKGDQADRAGTPLMTARAGLFYVVAVGLWSLIIVAASWYPFDFRFDVGFLRERVARLAEAPLATYYFGTEFRAATEFLRRVLLFSPIGILAGLAVRSFTGHLSKGNVFAGALLFSVFAAVIEAGQLMLPEKFPNAGDWLIESIAGLLGLGAVRLHYREARRNSAGPIAGPANTDEAKPLVVKVALAVLVLGLGLWAVTKSPTVPYNVRELVNTDFPLLTAILLAAAGLLALAAPVWVVGRVANGNWGLRHLVASTVLHGLAVWLILYVAVPVESMDDIVGSPVLGWSWEWERLGRFLGLFSAVSALLALAVTGSASSLGAISARVWVVVIVNGFFWAAVGYWVVVVQADTDNLTELMADNASVISAAWLILAILMVFWAGSRLAAVSWVMRRRDLIAALVIVALGPLSYFCVIQGTDNYIIKYDRVFSALQFLLSSDRDHYVNGVVLYGRYAAAYLFVVLAVFLSHWAFLRRFLVH